MSRPVFSALLLEGHISTGGGGPTATVPTGETWVIRSVAFTIETWGGTDIGQVTDSAGIPICSHPSPSVLTDADLLTVTTNMRQVVEEGDTLLTDNVNGNTGFMVRVSGYRLTN